MPFAGPTSAAGKAVSSRNALKHGLRARAIVLPSESQDDWESFEHTYLEDLAPVGIAEETLALRAAELLWRMRRVATAERDAVLDRQQHPDDYSLASWRNHSKYPMPSAAPDVLPDTLPAPAALRPIMRYEAHLSRQFFQVTRELQAIQDRRNGRTAQVTRVEVHGFPGKTKSIHIDHRDVAPPPTPVVDVAAGSQPPPAVQSPAEEKATVPDQSPHEHQYPRSFSSAESPSSNQGSDAPNNSEPPASAAREATTTKVPNELQRLLAPSRDPARDQAVEALLSRLLDPARYQDDEADDWFNDPESEAEDEALEDAMSGYPMPRFKSS